MRGRYKIPILHIRVLLHDARNLNETVWQLLAQCGSDLAFNFVSIPKTDHVNHDILLVLNLLQTSLYCRLWIDIHQKRAIDGVAPIILIDTKGARDSTRCVDGVNNVFNADWALLVQINSFVLI